jgi:hypothetical protein
MLIYISMTVIINYDQFISVSLFISQFVASYFSLVGILLDI